MRFTRTLPLLCCCFRLCAAQQTETALSTERPTVSYTADITARGNVVVESGIGVADAQGYVFDGPQIFVRYGVGHGVEVRALLPDRGDLNPARSPHWQDSAFGVKAALPAPGPWHMATGVTWNVPTGSGGVSSGGVDTSILFSAARPIKGRVASYGSAVVGWPSDGNGHRSTQLQLAFDMTIALSGSTTLVTEWAPLIAAGDDASQVSQAAVTWLASPRVQLDAHAGALEKGGTSLVAGCGISFLLGKRHMDRTR